MFYNKYIICVLLHLFVFFLLHGLSIVLPESEIEYIFMVIGGACALYFLFQAKTHFARFYTIYGLLLSDLFLYLHHYGVAMAYVAIITLVISAFFFLFGFANPKKDDARFEFTFLVLQVLRFFVPDPFIFHFESIFLVAQIFLFLFDRETLQKKKGVFFGFILIFFFF